VIGVGKLPRRRCAGAAGTAPVTGRGTVRAIAAANSAGENSQPSGHGHGVAWRGLGGSGAVNRGRLKGVGARIVAETFHRAMEGSHTSIVRDPSWRPTLGPDSTTFRMVDLLLFAFKRKKSLLAPLG
jgi:hypothetical protein